jgi:anti-sigma B factor antagonist
MANALHETKRIRVAREDDVATAIILEDSLVDAAVVRELGDQLFDLVDKLGYTKIILDFCRVAYISSAALNKLIVLHKKISAAHGRLVLCDLRPTVRDVFRVTRLNQKFDIERDQMAARKRI